MGEVWIDSPEIILQSKKISRCYYQTEKLRPTESSPTSTYPVPKSLQKDWWADGQQSGTTAVGEALVGGPEKMLPSEKMLVYI